MQGGTRAAEQFLVVTIHYVSVDEAKSLWLFEKPV
jgi:hypothetical protein